MGDHGKVKDSAIPKGPPRNLVTEGEVIKVNGEYITIRGYLSDGKDDKTGTYRARG